jgi:hypothetical protein
MPFHDDDVPYLFIKENSSFPTVFPTYFDYIRVKTGKSIKI